MTWIKSLVLPLPDVTLGKYLNFCVPPCSVSVKGRGKGPGLLSGLKKRVYTKYLKEMSWLRGDRTDRYRAVTRENPRAASVEAADLLGSLSDALCCLGHG